MLVARRACRRLAGFWAVGCTCVADIVIDDEFAELCPDLTDEERMGLMVALERDGYRDPLVVWQHKCILLDGHNRFDVYQLNHINEGDDSRSAFSTVLFSCEFVYFVVKKVVYN